jgi:hypothetical protein
LISNAVAINVSGIGTLRVRAGERQSGRRVLCRFRCLRIRFNVPTHSHLGTLAVTTFIILFFKLIFIVRFTQPARTTVVNDSKSAHSHRCHTLVTQQRTIALAFKQLNDYLSTRLTGRAPDVGSEGPTTCSNLTVFNIFF